MYNLSKLSMLRNALNKPSLLTFKMYVFSEQKGWNGVGERMRISC